MFPATRGVRFGPGLRRERPEETIAGPSLTRAWRGIRAPVARAPVAAVLRHHRAVADRPTAGVGWQPHRGREGVSVATRDVGYYLVHYTNLDLVSDREWVE